MKHNLLISTIFLAATISLSGCSSEQNTTPTPVETHSVVEPTQTQESEAPAVPTEWTTAVTKAQTYVDTLSFSKEGLFDQLTSEHAEKYSAEAAQYAVDTIVVDWNEEALEAAIAYQRDMAMSPEAIRDQLVHPNGNKFTQEEADYAVSNLP